MLTKLPLKGTLKALKTPVPTLSRGRTTGMFAEGDPRPYCDRCQRVPSELIVGPSLVGGTYLCQHCWGRV